jgi:uncharacterized protein YcaQ
MPAQQRETIATIAQQVRDYLSTHPRAADTLEGISGWWLPQQDGQASPELVQQALDYLVSRNEVVRVRSADGHVLYARGER